MGIRGLNKLLKNVCIESKSIQKIDLRDLNGKILVIDTMNYLYRFKAENALIENMFIFISSLLQNNIQPIFVFDGKAPPEKSELLKQRRIDKKIAEEKYDILKQKNTTDMNEKEYNYYMNEVEKCKRNITRITEDDLNNIKRLMDAYGVIYYEAEYEADELCVYIVQSKMAWGCVSDDMDLLLYDCPYILRNLSLLNQTIWIYDKEQILNDIGMTTNEFLDIIVMSGTDYNIKTILSLEDSISLWKQYCCHTENEGSFYEWISEKAGEKIDIQMMEKTIGMFSCVKTPNVVFNKKQKKINITKLKMILENENFLFI